MTPDELRQLQEVYGWINAVLADGRVFATKLDALIKSNSEPIVKLPVPYLSQNNPQRTDDDYSNSDCGPACVAMVVNSMGRSITVDDASKATGLPVGFKYTMPANLIKSASAFGVSLVHMFGTLTLDAIRQQINAGRPIIVLIHYGSLPLRWSQTFTAGHYIVVCGLAGDDFLYHDPYWPNSDGAYVRISAADLAKVMADCKIDGNTANQGLVVKP